MRRYLQSPESNVVLSESRSLYEHGLASVKCLLSGVDIFGPPASSQPCLLPVLRGIHSFHIYASQYWMEYLLSYVTSTPEDVTSEFVRLSSYLSFKFSSWASDRVHKKANQDTGLLDARLTHLQQHQDSLYLVAKAILLEQHARYIGDVSQDSSE